MASKVTVRKSDGGKKGNAELPEVFGTPFRPDVIRKAVKAAQANRRQAHGPSPMAGAMHSTASAGKGRGLSRVPRLMSGNTGALAPPTVGGRRAHPPRPEKVWSRRLNQKERRLAVRSALAATADAELVARRGHRFDDETVALPVVVDASFEDWDNASDVRNALEKLGLGDDLARAEAGIRERAGRGKSRGRRLRRPSSLLIVAGDASKLRRAAGNLPGVEVADVAHLNAERLAPGGTAGRLTVFTEPALKALEEMA